MAYRYLFEQMVRREMRQKYKGSALGVLWYVINPLVLMGAYYLMFGVIFKLDDIEDFPLFLMVGLVVWIFFSQSVLSAAPSLLEQGALVRKARFPRATIPGAVVSVQLATFGVMLALVLPVALIIRGSAGAPLLLLPVVVALLFCLVLGLSLAVAVLHAHFRDVEPVLAAALLPWFFLTPIFLRVDDMPGVSEHRTIGDLLEWANPIAPFVQAVRDVLFAGVAPSLGVMAYLAAVGLGALAGGVFLFRRLERDLAVLL